MRSLWRDAAVTVTDIRTGDLDSSYWFGSSDLGTLRDMGAFTAESLVVDSKNYHLIEPDDLSWRPSGIMKIPNADFLERTGTTLLGARLWRLPPKSANTLHKHVKSAEFYFVLEGVGRMRVGDDTLTVPRYGAVFVGPTPIRQVFNDTDADVLWLIVGAPEEERMPYGPDDPAYYPRDARELPRELAGANWPLNS